MKPLSLRHNGLQHYPYVFASDGAERLSDMFAKQRNARPADPLVPELQVILHHLIEGVKRKEGSASGPVVINVPDNDTLNAELRHASANHLARVFDRAVPTGHDWSAARLARTKTLLALSRLTMALGSGLREFHSTSSRVCLGQGDWN